MGDKVNRELIAENIWKTAILMAIGFVMAAGLVLFNNYRLTLMHQQPHFAGMYAAIIRYDLSLLLDKLNGSTQAGDDSTHAASVPVLVYHGIGPKPAGENISLSSFTDQMLALKRAGYHAVSIQEFYEFMREGRKLPAKSILITFDDGRKDSFYPVDPLLAALDFRATMFVITKSAFGEPSPFYLDKGELLTMRDTGRWDLQPHAAYGHYLYPVDELGKTGNFYNNKLWLKDENRLETEGEFAGRITDDLRTAKSEMRRHTGSSGIAFAFPYNEFGVNSHNYPDAHAVLMQAVQANFPMAFYQVWAQRGASQNFPQDSSFLMRRIEVTSEMDTDELMQKLDDSSAKPLPYRNDLKRQSGAWLGTWGDYFWSSSGLTIRAVKESEGAGIFLDGGRGWENYSATARLELLSGEWSRIYGRYQDAKNYVSCTFSAGQVLLMQTIGGVNHYLAREQVPVAVGDIRAGFTARGPHAECTVDGQTTASSELDPQFSHGSIGFAVFGPKENTSALRISDVLAEELR